MPRSDGFATEKGSLFTVRGSQFAVVSRSRCLRNLEELDQWNPGTALRQKTLRAEHWPMDSIEDR
jgi:hypothetical protein